MIAQTFFVARKHWFIAMTLGFPMYAKHVLDVDKNGTNRIALRRYILHYIILQTFHYIALQTLHLIVNRLQTSYSIKSIARYSITGIADITSHLNCCFCKIKYHLMKAWWHFHFFVSHFCEAGHPRSLLAVSTMLSEKLQK